MDGLIKAPCLEDVRSETVGVHSSLLKGLGLNSVGTNMRCLNSQLNGLLPTGLKVMLGYAENTSIPVWM